MIRLIWTPVRKLLQFPLVQFSIVILLILLMQAADESTVLGEAFDGLDKLVDWSVRAVSAVVTVKSFTRSGLTFWLMIAYVYLACWALAAIARIMLGLLIDIIGRNNILWLRHPIARERGAEAYRAWLPLERIRPQQIPQAEWETTYAWPPNNAPPYPPLAQRVARGMAVYAILIAAIAIALQEFTPVPVLSWIESGLKRAAGL